MLFVYKICDININTGLAEIVLNMVTCISSKTVEWAWVLGQCL